MKNFYKISVHYNGWGENWRLGDLVSNGRQILFEYSGEALRSNQ